MQSLYIVKEKIIPQTLPGFTDRPVFMKIDLFILDCPPQPLDKDVIINPAATILLIFISFPWSMGRNSELVNWAPWSVLKYSGQSLSRASFKASQQKPDYNVVDSCQEII